MRADSLEKQLQNRPKPDELIKEGILEGEDAYISPLSPKTNSDILGTADENPLKD
jgi:hypothetical protein